MTNERAVAQCSAMMRSAGLDEDTIAAGLAAGAGDAMKAVPELEICLRALWHAEGDLTGPMVGAAFGVKPHVIYRRFDRLRLRLCHRRRSKELDGEIWRAVPGKSLQASNKGRVRNRRGVVLTPRIIAGRLRVYPRCGMVTVSSAVMAAFRGTPLKLAAKHLNGDIADCRLVNLASDRMRKRPGVIGGDHPWTIGEMRALRQSQSYAEAVRRTGHTITHVKRRMKEMGLNIPAAQPCVRRPLVERDLAAVTACVAALEAAGADDREINLGVGITNLSRQSMPEVQVAVGNCLQTLFGLLPIETVRAGFGWRKATIQRHLNNLGLIDTRRPEGWRSTLGPPGYLEGEEWRAVKGWRAEVSSFGRVTGASGHLMRYQRSGQGRSLSVRLISNETGALTSHLVASLVLEAFRPELHYRDSAYLDGDPSNPRLDNLVRADAIERAPNQASLFEQARAACPRWFEPHVREDLITDMVIIMMDGRAPDMAGALAIARREHNAMTGAWKERSIDAPVGAEGEFSLLDMLTDEGEFYTP